MAESDQFPPNLVHLQLSLAETQSMTQMKNRMDKGPTHRTRRENTKPEQSRHGNDIINKRKGKTK